MLAVRNGTLDLHGRPVDITWTYLGRTAEVDATSITLDRPVSWSAGDEIVIASTGDKSVEGGGRRHAKGRYGEMFGGAMGVWEGPNSPKKYIF